MPSAASSSRRKTTKSDTKVSRSEPSGKLEVKEEHVDRKNTSSSDSDSDSDSESESESESENENENETTSASSTSVDIQQRKQQRLSRSERLANHLPSGFLRNETDPMRYFFVGFYARSGIHVSWHPGFRIALKAISFVSLHKLLHRCGVPSPVLRQVAKTNPHLPYH